MIRFCIVLLVCLAGNAQAQSLNFPSNASLERAVVSPLDSYGVPMGIWENGTVPMQIAEGRVSTQAWRVATASLTTLQLLRPLREQLRNARYRVIFECQTEACGGFDFRFATDALPPPEMQINIMNSRVTALVAQDPKRWALAGDQLYIDMDLSPENLPAGTKLSIGSAVLEVTSPPHTGCKKFVARFGRDAMIFVNTGIGKELNFRGINAKVVQPGTIQTDDIVKKL